MYYLCAVVLVYAWECRGRRWVSGAPWRQCVGGRALANALLGLVALCLQSTALMATGWLLGGPGHVWTGQGLNLVGLPLGVQLAANLLIFTFLGYWVHRLMHASSRLWMLHRVHHSDSTVSPSLVFRHHPLEELINLIPFACVSALVMVDGVVTTWSAMYLLASGLLQHAGVRWSPHVERHWSWLIPTPACHWVHHEQDRGPSNHNFSDHFPLWDRLFGTYMLPRPPGQVGIAYGVPGMAELNAAELTESGFKRY